MGFYDFLSRLWEILKTMVTMRENDTLASFH